jgi:hypothetical protein
MLIPSDSLVRDNVNFHQLKAELDKTCRYMFDARQLMFNPIIDCSTQLSHISRSTSLLKTIAPQSCDAHKAQKNGRNSGEEEKGAKP